MRAMLFEQPKSPLRWTECPRPEPAENQVLLRVKACGVCRTDLHVL
ncbi:MAG: alcohol dehydrogenase propanol-preferring, partial [Planctomycetota bacterium]